MPPTILARRGTEQFMFSTEDPTLVQVFDAGSDTLFPPFAREAIELRGSWDEVTTTSPGVDAIDMDKDDALEAAQARVATLLGEDPTPEKTSEEGLPGTEKFTDLSADSAPVVADGGGDDEGDAGGDEGGGGGDDMEGDTGDGGDVSDASASANDAEAFAADDKVVPDEAAKPEEFTVTLLEEGVPTIDGRIFAPNSVTWRNPPIPLMFTTENTGEGHKGSKLGGTITRVFRDGLKVKGAGRFDSGDNGQELKRLITDRVLNGVSSDVGGALAEMGADENGVQQQQISQGRIMGATCLPFPAFDETRIAVTSALEAVVGDDTSSVSADAVQEPIKKSDDQLADAAQAAQLSDIAQELTELADRVDQQAEVESEQAMDTDDADQMAMAARIDNLELAVTSLVNRMLAKKAAEFGSNACATCDGTGKIKAGNVQCPSCGGSGKA